MKERLVILKHSAIIVGALTALATLAACSSGDTPTPTAAPADTSQTGARLFLTNGCATCHGQDALGTDIAPALPGHTEDQVVRQVRRPVGHMPAFSESQISDAELDLLADYIASLGPGEQHTEPISLGEDEVLAMHHWMALSAIQDDNLTEADHHLKHIIELIDEPDHLRIMQEIEQAVSSRDLHEAEHLLEGHLADTLEPNLSTGALHARLALAALATDDTDDARHHLEHARASPDDSGLSDVPEAAMAKIDAGEPEEAEHLIEGALEESDHGH